MELREHLRKLWTEELYKEYENVLFQFRVRLRPVVIRIDDVTSVWGSWHPLTRTIVIAARLIEKHGWDEYALWHLGEDPDASEETKGRYSFPYGDFRRVHRCAVISLESRAAQNDHDDIARETKKLLETIDGD